ncbi:hypothetical protein [Mucilaginibacter sp.]|uniref:hypothetical protein n=1 Tax=Mucilaginibacter sp. TaxID=1882438 RepID=UPI000CBBB1F8|nr:hypothetical protein [Mucilaginibacter sp.]PLW89979.1 MAG: hypothetical protein C0154_08630 [Mucilaginibacter sp.]PMP65773.1 MAG: hypothetical protein C0191_02620 [Mucilaginibacter sp.]
MKTIKLPNEGANEFTLDIAIGAFAVNTSKKLMNADGSVNIAGSKTAYYFNSPADATEEAIELRHQMMDNIENELVNYYKKVNGLED